MCVFGEIAEKGEVVLIFDTTEGLLLFTILIPGFIIYNAMDQYLTRERPTDIRLLLYYLTYSGIYLIGISFLFPMVLEWWTLGLYVVVLPLIIGLIIGYVVNSEWWADIKSTVFHIYKEPYPTAWDAFFNRRLRELRGCHVIVTLRNGNKVMGLLDRDSSASEYPIANDIYLEKVYLDDTFTPKSGSAGIWLPREMISHIEFYKKGE